MYWYFGWLAQKGYPMPENRDDIWLPEGEDAITGATRHHLRKYGPRIPAILESGAEVISATGAVRGEIIQAVRKTTDLGLPRRTASSPARVLAP